MDKTLQRFQEVEKLFNSGALTSVAEMTELAKEKSRLGDIVGYIQEHAALTEELGKLENAVLESRELEQEWIDMAIEERDECRSKLDAIENDIIHCYIPKAKEDLSNAILELRPGPGGQEASIFASDILDIYQNYAAVKGWSFTILNSQETDMGGLRVCLLVRYECNIVRFSTNSQEATISVKGTNVFSTLKFESGVHRVQRVPITEASGRLHTSTMSVVVLPELEEMEMVEIPPKELKIDTFRATGAGGQHVNTTDSAIRITHIPSGIVVSIQTERNQHQNKKIAMGLITNKVHQWQQSQLNQGRESSRSSQIGTAERYERIRTYNYPQDRVTDHRINENFFGIDNMATGTMLVEIHEKLKDWEVQLALEKLIAEE